MKEVALERRLNTYLYRGYPWIYSNFENGAKQLEPQLKNRVANKKKYVPSIFLPSIYSMQHDERKYEYRFPK